MVAHRSELSPLCRAAWASRAAASNESQSDAAPPQATSIPSEDAPPPPQGGLGTVATRIAEREFPSVFQPWNHAENLHQSDNSTVALSTRETPLLSEARHDLYWGAWPQLGLKLAAGETYPLQSPAFDPDSIKTALKNRATMLAANPHMVILGEVHYRSAPPTFLPPDSPLWGQATNSRDMQRYGNRPLDLGNPELQDKVAAFCAALIRTGVYDGCMFDLWLQNDNTAAGQQQSLALIRKIRAAVGEGAILIANVNGRLPIQTAAYLNGMYMEGFGAPYFPDWRTAAGNLLWGEAHLHKPAITALEGWWQTTGRSDLPLMREVTTLSLVFSNGYVLFGDPNGPPDHRHDLYSFWDKSLGKPVDPLAALDRPDLSGAYTRRYEHGEVVFNPPSNQPVTIGFNDLRRSAATGTVARSFTLAQGDGDLFLVVGSSPDQRAR
jgi:hypothetical protein